MQHRNGNIEGRIKRQQKGAQLTLREEENRIKRIQFRRQQAHIKLQNAKLERLALQIQAGQTYVPQDQILCPTSSAPDRTFNSDGEIIMKKTASYYGATQNQNLWNNIYRISDRNLKYKLQAKNEVLALDRIEARVKSAHEAERQANEERVRRMRQQRAKFQKRYLKSTGQLLTIPSPMGNKVDSLSPKSTYSYSSPAYDRLAKPRIRYEHPERIPLSHQIYSDLHLVRDEGNINRRVKDSHNPYNKKIRDRRRLEGLKKDTGFSCNKSVASGFSTYSSYSMRNYEKKRMNENAKRTRDLRHQALKMLNELEEFERRKGEIKNFDDSVYCNGLLTHPPK